MPRDPLWEFTWAAAILLVINVIPIVSTIIKAYWHISAKNLAGSDQRLLNAMVQRVPASAGIGLIEQLLYVYCFTSAHREFIGAILLFKAFFGWVTIKPTGGDPNVPATITLQGKSPHGPLTIKLLAETGATDEGHHLILARFYTYAIGNFISLAVAIFVFEIVHLWGYSFLPYFHIPRS